MNLYVHKINKATSQWYHRLSERYRIGNSICQQVIEGTLSLHIAPIPLTSLNSSVRESTGCIKKNHSISKCFHSAAIHPEQLHYNSSGCSDYSELWDDVFHWLFINIEHFVCKTLYSAMYFKFSVSLKYSLLKVYDLFLIHCIFQSHMWSHLLDS